jgi:oxygen-independent coproporphyrinogen-3 oxidase
LSDFSAIYIHIPFCIKKCGYCDFYSITDLDQVPVYVTGLIKEITRMKTLGKPVETIYFGGGTPSVLTASDINRILSAISQSVSLSSDLEITLEANPGATLSRFKAYARAGINRLSIGVQSFDDKKLGFLTRIHSVAEAASSLAAAHGAGFKNIAMDLMFGLPFETRDQWQKDLEQALYFAPDHLSCYMLTIEPGTPFSDLADKKKNYAFVRQ